MYNILFNLCGVAILEIFIFFFYIGPVETSMFNSKLTKLISDSLNELYDKRDSLTLLEKQLINEIIYNSYYYSSDEVKNELLTESNNSKHTRIEYNNLLLYESLTIWGIFLLISICSYISYKVYLRSYTNKNNMIAINYTSLSDSELNNMEENITAYRKSSKDYEEEIHEKLENYNSNEKKKKFLNYAAFAGLFIIFQYMFFNYIICNYTPLSLDEIRYIAFIHVDPFLENMTNGENITDSTRLSLVTKYPKIM